MAKKWYAVKKGRVPGLYATWLDCEKQVKGYGGAIYKSFTSKAEAEQFMQGESIVDKRSDSTSYPHEGYPYVAYVDGSYDSCQGIVGYGGVILVDGEEVHRFSQATQDSHYSSVWNVAGEILAACYAVEYAQEQSWLELAIFYDYQGIEMWATGAWKAHLEITQDYARYMQKVQQKISLRFHKVAAHQGVYFNELADKLAKAGIREHVFSQ